MSLTSQTRSCFPQKGRGLYLTLAFMVSILLWNIFGNEFLNFLPELETGWTVIAIMLVSGISFGLLSWYYAKKGEF